MHIEYMNESKLLADLWKIKTLQDIFDSADIFTFTEDFIIKAFAVKYNIKNENSELIMLLEEMYLQAPDKVPTIGELLEICKEKGILKEEENG